MATLTVRDLDPDLVRRLRVRAAPGVGGVPPELLELGRMEAPLLGGISWRRA